MHSAVLTSLPFQMRGNWQWVVVNVCEKMWVVWAWLAQWMRPKIWIKEGHTSLSNQISCQRISVQLIINQWSLVQGGKVEEYLYSYPLAGGMGETWQLDRKNIQPRILARTLASRKQVLHKRTKLLSQTSTAVSTLTDTEAEGSDSSLTPPDTCKSFNAQEYNDKNPNNKWVKTSATAEAGGPCFSLYYASGHVFVVREIIPTHGLCLRPAKAYLVF
jgi:hypothetical protein